ncbi:MAG: ParA family protein [Ruminobacter sp.]|jgi:chromosome partitioning protein|uniref:Chromosome partitioning protein n=1 Tax=Ruminobacter amylophilus TaxID=867 RepID=A0A662ZIX6_9GAMM|nr:MULTISPECIES: ParA family protein [Ruminobacter]MBQ3775137.1 ParA family protein [Ruminobacter sp.]SFP56015.1 chromosome partitioning protein [Ruminobacter amylophilus]
MGKIIAFANQKGGVGKTTTCVNLSASLATQKKILLVDLDPQGNATMASGISKFDIEKNVYNILMEGTKAEDEILTETTGGYHIIPTNSDLTAAEVGLMNFYARESRLKKALDEIKNRYDFIFIDCPPALNLLTVNALCAADSIIVPMQCEYFSLEGLSALTDTIKQIKENINEKLKIEGILRTMFDGRARLATEVSDDLIEHFKDKIYKTIIPRNIKLAEAPSYGKPALYYDKSCLGAKAYLALAGEFLNNQEKNNSIN